MPIQASYCGNGSCRSGNVFYSRIHYSWRESGGYGPDGCCA